MKVLGFPFMVDAIKNCPHWDPKGVPDFTLHHDVQCRSRKVKKYILEQTLLKEGKYEEERRGSTLGGKAHIYSQPQTWPPSGVCHQNKHGKLRTEQI
jgi:hypothetical protein